MTLIRCYHSGPEWTWERWQGSGTLHFSKPQHYCNFTIRLFSVISRTLMGGGSYPTVEKQSVYSTALADWTNRMKMTCMQPQIKHRQLYSVLMHQGGLKDILHPRVMNIVECHTNHCFVRCQLNQEREGPLKSKVPGLKFPIRGSEKLTSRQHCPVGWGSSIHRLHLC